MPRILIIDDDPISRKVLRNMLELEGYDVFEAADGKKGVDAYRLAPADLVITDVFMPEKEGVETVRELRGIRREVPIIAVSGGGARGLFAPLAWMKKFGVRHTLLKPLRRDEVLAAVRELLLTD